eukprot:217359-Amphidinium_carterae.1
MVSSTVPKSTAPEPPPLSATGNAPSTSDQRHPQPQSPTSLSGTSDEFKCCIDTITTKRIWDECRLVEKTRALQKTAFDRVTLSLQQRKSYPNR